MALLSCTPEQKHGALTFFFDGVPSLHPVVDPREPVGKAGPEIRATIEKPSRPRVVWSEHEPARDKKSCGKCHDQNASLALLLPAAELCITCHQKETRQYPRMHGPTAVGDCGVCHDAHRAPRKHLVRAPVVELCFRCHDRTPEGGKTRGCVRASEEALCTECHNPHGGDREHFLVDRATPPQAPPPDVPSPDVPSPGEEGSRQ